MCWFLLIEKCYFLDILNQSESLTPLARNEFICWIKDAKNEETRVERIERTLNDLINGKRRPCCWIGCIHRKDKTISPSVKGILNKRSKNFK
ncbi:YdeI/OmpD-associated family protein [Candidatus Pacearchaeota archaeon]|nr:YdeI/OmpD-associated family protein [Candidatus Pacearchaeota archaeon]